MRNGKEAEIEVKGEVGKTNETEWNFKQRQSQVQTRQSRHQSVNESCIEELNCQLVTFGRNALLKSTNP